MAKQLRRILVAVRDPKHTPRNELQKAGTLARAAGASVELFHAIDEPDPMAGFPETKTREMVQHQRDAIATRIVRSLQRFAQGDLLKGVSVVCTAAWDYPPHEAVVRRALASQADLVIAGPHHGEGLGARLLLRNTDWELIRQCPVPLLLVKSRRPYEKPVVIAAVDPFHRRARPADLDAELLRVGGQLAQLLRGSLHVFHAYMPLVNVEPAPMSAPLVMLPPEAEEAHEEQINTVVGRLAESAGVPKARRYIRIGPVTTELAAVTRSTHADVVVMGAVSRTALVRMFIGNTAERVLDKLSCDVLVVKPRGFKTKVQKRPSPGVTGSPRAASGGRKTPATARTTATSAS
jgi:universal stress protein E